ncbi:MAG TPA: type II toxin-antitoxin system RelE/ParE family toxin [Xanthobacteraceae bacterium]|jgi:toxin ParE1/3/4
MKIFVSRTAAADLVQIYSYLAQRNPNAAERLAHRIDRKFGELSRFPFIGRERSSLGPGLRSTVIGTHVIFYTVQSDLITIVRVIDGRRDIDEEFRR